MRNRWFTASQLVLALICVMYFVSYVDRVNMATAAPLITKELGLSNAQMGTLFSVFAISYTLVHIFGGWVGDRYGARRTLFYCGIVWASATVLIGFAQGFYSLVLARLLLGFGEGFNFPTATLAMQRWVRKDARGFAQGLTHSFSRLANAVTPPLVVLLMGLFAGWRGGFILIGLLSLVWVFAWFWYYRDDPREHASVTPHELATLPYNTGAPENRSNIKVPWGQLVPRMLPITLTYFCYGWTLWVYLNWLPSFFKEAYGLDIKHSALFSSGVFLAGVVGDTLGGVISDHILKRTGDLKKARRNLIVFGYCFGALCLVPLFFTRDLVIVTLLLSAGFFALELIIAPMWAIPMDIAPQYSSSASALMSTGSTTAALVSPYIFGLIVDLSGSWFLPFAVSIGLLLIGIVLAFFMHPDRPFVQTFKSRDLPSSAPTVPAG